jgi:Histidine kinase-, DNA gyrase B-, and HSP90-like ATPase
MMHARSTCRRQQVHLITRDVRVIGTRTDRRSAGVSPDDKPHGCAQGHRGVGGEHAQPHPRVEISTALTTAGAAITVGNTGTLIPPDAVEYLFQPFRQLGTQRIRHNEGHGLGLPIIRAIADAHGAALTASPRPHGGLDMEVIFP